jgi:hypothetical protein
VTEAFIKIPRELLESAAWRALGINALRLLFFLMIEHMRHGGKANGALVAPRRQLEQFGIGARHISPSIEEAVSLGLIDCKRGVGRRPSRYALTWIALGDGTGPSNRWRAYRNDFRTELATNDFRREASRVSEGKSQRLLRLLKGSHKGSKRGYPKGSTSIEASYHGGADS